MAAIGLDHADATMPPRPPETQALAPGYQLLTETLYDRLEPVMDRLRRALRFNGLIEQNNGDPIGFDPFEQVLEFFYDAGSTSRNGL